MSNNEDWPLVMVREDTDLIRLTETVNEMYSLGYRLVGPIQLAWTVPLTLAEFKKGEMGYLATLEKVK